MLGIAGRGHGAGGNLLAAAQAHTCDATVIAKQGFDCRAGADLDSIRPGGGLESADEGSRAPGHGGVCRALCEEQAGRAVG